MSRYMTRREAAAFCTEELGAPVTRNTLTKMASQGGGPAYQIFGTKALYTEEALRAWVAAKLSPPRASTAQAERAAGSGGA